MEELDTVTINQLDDLTLLLTTYLAGTNANGKLGKFTAANFATYIAPYVQGIGSSGFVAVTGTVLPAASLGKYTIVGAGTFTQTTGGNVTTTGLLNILASNATSWSLVKAIDTTSLASKTDLSLVRSDVSGLQRDTDMIADLIPFSSVNRDGVILGPDPIMYRTDNIKVLPGERYKVTTAIWQSSGSNADKVIVGYSAIKDSVVVLADPRVIGGGTNSSPFPLTDYVITIPANIYWMIIPVHKDYVSSYKLTKLAPDWTVIAGENVNRAGVIGTGDPIISRTDYYPVTPGQILYISTSLWQSTIVASDRVVYGFSATKTPVGVLVDPRAIGGGTNGSLLPITDYKLTIPDGVYYIVIPFATANPTQLNISYGQWGAKKGINDVLTTVQKSVNDVVKLASGAVRVDYNMIFNNGLNVISHAGGFHLNYAPIAPINSILGAQNAARIGHRFVEFDCVFTKDEVPVVCHDLYLNDYFVNIDGSALTSTLYIKDFTLAQLRAQFRDKASTADNIILIPTVQDFINESIIGGWAPFVEVKGDAQITAARAKLLVDMLSAVNKCVIVAFDINALIALRAYSKSIALGYLLNASPSQSFADTCVTYNLMADINFIFATDAVLKMFKDSGVCLGVWTPTALDSALLIKRGVNIITSDYLPPSHSSVYKNRTVVQSDTLFTGFTNTGVLNSGIVTLVSGQQLALPAKQIYAYGYHRWYICYKGTVAIDIAGAYPLTYNSTSAVWDTICLAEQIGANTTATLTITGSCKIRSVRFESIEA